MRYATVTFIVVFLLVISGFAATIRVPSEQPNIQAGIDAAVDSDTVLVADGTYMGPGDHDIDFKGKAITVMSENGPDLTTIECLCLVSRGFYFHTNEDSRSKLDGFTITKGDASYGGGIYCAWSSPTITNCIITENTVSGCGGGIYCTDSSPTIMDCIITENTVDGRGGGLYCAWSSPSITNCIITGNTTTQFGNGGGIKCYESSPTITNCIITENSAGDPDGHGGGIHCSYESSPIIANCTFTGNRAGHGGGIYCSNSSPVITNCILWENYWEEIYVSSGDPVVTYSDIEGGWEGEGNIDLDPRFVPFPVRGFEYLLRPDSPCVDAGDPHIYDWLYDWHPRWPDWYPDGARSDMGAYGGPGNVGWVK